MQRTSCFACLTILLLAGGLAAGCASTARVQAPTPAGAWEYVIANTPQGDATGTMMVTGDGGAYGGEISSDLLNQAVSMEEVAFQDSTFTFKATFDADGQMLPTATRMTINGNRMKGTIDVTGFGIFDITATRKVSEGGS